MLFGVNKIFPVLLKAINVDIEKVGRFRDIWIDEGKKKIILLTRLGGGNRDYYQENIEYLRKNPLCYADYDDDFDCTYAYFEFKIPEKWKGVIDDLYEIQGKPISLQKKFEDVVEYIKNTPKEQLEKDKRFSPFIEIMKKIGGE